MSFHSIEWVVAFKNSEQTSPPSSKKKGGETFETRVGSLFLVYITGVVEGGAYSIFHQLHRRY